MSTSEELRRLWRDSAPLTAVFIAMLLDAIVCGLALLFDARQITGVSAWLKPLKFAISTAIFSATVAWLFRYIRVWPRFGHAAGWVVAATLALEIAVIDIQAARGTTSHFNIATASDALLFTAMGIAIGMLWLASAGISLALFRQPFKDAAWGWSLRTGMAITVLGAAAAGLMLAPTAEQSRAAQPGHRPTLNGGHTVGAADGGPGIPLLGWSLDHGDLRIPHFFGLHAVQVIPFLAWMSRRRRHRTGFTFACAASYLGFIIILAWQALRGESIAHPGVATLEVLALWLGTSLFVVTAFGRRNHRHEVAA